MNAVRRGLVASLLFLFFGAGCATTQPRVELPPITESPTGLHRVGTFVWVDLVTSDVAAARRFYGALFDWEFEGTGDYVGVSRDGRPIGGIVYIEPDEQRERESAWVGSLSVEDVSGAASLVKAQGGEVHVGPETDARGEMVLVSDPGGALVLLLRASQGDPPERRPELGDWLWRELWTRDAKQATDFYAALVGYEPRVIDVNGHPYHVLERDGRPRAGVVEAPMEEVEPTWLPYVRVADVPSMAKRAEELGAHLVLQDQNVAILVDPVGAPIGLQYWEKGEEEDGR